MNAFTDKRPFEISFCLNKWFSTCLPCRYQRVSEWWLVQLHGWVSQVRQHSWLLQVWMWSRLVLYWWKMQRYLIIFRRKFPGSWGVHCSVILLFAFWYLTVEFWAWQSYQAQISKAQSTSREAFNNKTGSCCYISNYSYLSPGGGSDFFRGGGGITWFLGGMEGDQSSPTEYTGGVIKILHSLMEGSGTNKGHSLYSLSLTEQIMST